MDAKVVVLVNVVVLLSVGESVMVPGMEEGDEEGEDSDEEEDMSMYAQTA